MSSWQAAPLRSRVVPTALVALAAAGVALGGLVRPAPVPCVAIATLAAILAAVGERARCWRLAALSVCLVVGGLGWGSARAGQRDPGAVVRTSAAVSGDVLLVTPVRARHGERRTARAAAIDVRGVSAGDRLLVELPARGPLPRAGQILRVRGRLRPPASATAPAWWRRALEREGIAGRLDVATVRIVGRRGGIAGVRDRWREWVRERVAHEISGDARALVRGMAIGAVDELSEEDAERLRASGLWHLVAVSGQNVMVVAIAVMALLGLCGWGRRGCAVGGIGAVVAYCLACDGGASVARAGVMGVVGLIAVATGSRRRGWHALAVGLLVLLAWSPRSVGDPGLQLSFAATAGLIGLSGPIAQALAGWVPARLALPMAQALAAGLATAPVLVWDFGTASPVGVLAGVIAVPIAGPVVVLALIGAVGGAVVPLVGLFATGVAGVGADLVLAVAAIGARLPGAGVALPRMSAVPLVALAVVPWLLTWHLARPARRRAGRSRSRVAAALAVVGSVAIGLVLTRGGPAVAWPAEPSVTALDVGQGDAILLTDPQGTAILVDSGPPGEPPPVIAALRRRGVGRLDALAITHDQADHAGGAASVLGRLSVGLLLVPPLPPSSGGGRVAAVMAAAQRRGVTVARPVAGDTLKVGAWSVSVLLPDAPPPAGADPNDAGLVAVAQAGTLSVLLTADVEGGTLARAPLPSVDVLKVSHHGSDDDHLGAVLDRVAPTVALISSGPNTYGHPHPETLGTLASAGILARRTDVAGDVTVTERADGAMSVTTSRR